MQYLEPPPPAVDSGPSVPAPDDNSIYVPGCWMYRSSRYLWRPGYWMGARPGWTWSPAHYCYIPAGYVYADGFWDYAPEDRGLLFAPVSFNQPLWTNPGWYYRPRFALGFGDLLSCLFVRPSYCHYYFGDYYGPAYAGLGFQPWFAYGRRHHDPLFGYYGWRHRNDFTAWYGGLRNTFTGRVRGDLPRPPHTLAQQDLHTTNPQLVKPLSQFRDGRVSLTRLSAAQVAEQARATQRFQDLRVQRGNVERAARFGTAPRTLSLANVPTARSSTHAELNARPPRPDVGVSAARPGPLSREFHSTPLTDFGRAPANTGRTISPHTANLAPRAPALPPYRAQHFGNAALAPGRLPPAALPSRHYSRSSPGVIAPRPSYSHAVTHASSPARSFARPRSVAPPAHTGGGHSGHHK